MKKINFLITSGIIVALTACSGGGGGSPTPIPDPDGGTGLEIYLFAGSNGVDGYELWTSDGTPDGTIMVKDINPSGSSLPSDHMFTFNNEVYFVAND